MTARRRILRNAASNYVGYFTTIVVALFLSPFIVHSLGDETYGIWTLLVALTGYYGLLDLGVRGAVSVYLARYLGTNDQEGVNRTVNTSLVLLCAASVLVVLATIVIIIFFPYLFDVAPDKIRDARIGAGIMGLLFALTPPMAVWHAIIIARERFDIVSGVGVVTRLVSAGLTVWVLNAGYGMVGLASVHFGASTISWAFNLWVCRRLVPYLKISPRLFRKDAIRELGSFGFFLFVGRLAAQIIDYSDVIVIALVWHDPVAVAFYTIGHMLVPYFRDLLGAATRTIAPLAASIDAQGDRARLGRLLKVSTRWTFLVACVIAGGVFILGRDFLGLWMGEKYVSGETYASCATILMILATAMLARMFQYCGFQVLAAMREVKFLARNGILEAAANLVLSLILIRYYGLIGVALGTLGPCVVKCLWVEPNYVLKKTGMGWGEFLRAVVPGPTVAFATMWLFALIAGVTLGPVDGWGDLILKGFMITTPATIVGFLITATQEERQAIASRIPFIRNRKAKGA